MAQLPLALELDSVARFETFVAGANGATRAHVERCAAEGHDSLWLSGAPGTGKSHLLQAACRHAGRLERSSMYLPLGSGRFSPEALEGLDAIDLLALDDCERVARNSAWEESLFGLLNAVRDAGGGLLMASRCGPGEAGFVLPDLASRVKGAVRYRLRPLDDENQLEALRRHAEYRGLELDDAAARYLLSRVPRDQATVMAWIERLDRASLREQRRLTVPFIRRLLAAGE